MYVVGSGNPRIRIIRADITTQEVDAIVNAANASLCGGGGVDGAIHDAAGPELLAHCRTLGAGRPGEVKCTPGFELHARLIFHAVGPVWDGGRRGEPAQLARCYREAFRLAREHDVQSLAFPAISTGAYRFPLRRATEIAKTETLEGLEHALPTTVVFCCFSERDRRVYEEVFGEV